MSFRGIYRHLKHPGKLYFVDGLARSVNNPKKISVIYTQQYNSVLKGTDTNLPKGTMWIRDLDNFQKNFTKVDQTGAERLITSVITSLEKDILYGHNKD